MPNALYILDDRSRDLIYGPDERRDIARLVDVVGPPLTSESAPTRPDLLRQAELVFSGWGAPCFDSDLLAMMPKLRAVFYGAGSIRGLVSDAFWERQITVCSAWAANAVPVAEFTLAQILLSLKRCWHYALTVKRDGAYPRRFPVPGGYGSTVGLISLGMVGRNVCRLLEPFDVQVIAHDPYVDAASAAELGVALCSLEDVFARADVVSLHTPLLDSTRGMITGAHLDAMKPGATFINTARGGRGSRGGDDRRARTPRRSHGVAGRHLS